MLGSRAALSAPIKVIFYESPPIGLDCSEMLNGHDYVCSVRTLAVDTSVDLRGRPQNESGSPKTATLI